MKRIVLKGAAFALIVLALQAPLTVLRGWRSLTPKGDRDGRPSEVLFFGDSVQESVAPADADRRDLFEMVRDRLGDRRVGRVNGPAYGPELFEAYVRHLLRQPSKPSVFLIPINLRSLSPEWESRPEYQFRAEKFRLAWGNAAGLALLRPLNAFKAYPLTPVSQQEYRAYPVFREGRPVGRVRDFLSRHEAPPGMALEEGNFVFRYMNTVTPDSRGLRALRDIARRCRDGGIAARFYVTPVDVESGERAAGPGFRRQVAANVAVLREALESERAPLLDLSLSLDAGAFDWRRNLVPNEHLNERGRLALATRLAELVRNP